MDSDVAVLDVREVAGNRFRTGEMPLRNLAEAVILQSIEDLWDPSRKRESIRFFRGEGFRICAEVAGMSREKKLSVLKMLADAGMSTRSHSPGRAVSY